MRMTFKALIKQLFGAKYERLARTLFLYVIVFWGLYIADWSVEIALSIQYLMLTTFTAGVMWQAFCSKDQTVHMQNLFMLPFDNREFVFSYVAALGAYTVFTKTAALLAVLLAVSDWSLGEMFGSILCLIHAILTTAAIYSLKKYWYVAFLWPAAIIAIILIFGNQPWFILLLLVNSTFAAILLQKADAYTFYLQDDIKRYDIMSPTGAKRKLMTCASISELPYDIMSPTGAKRKLMTCASISELPYNIKGQKQYSVWRYLFRYLKYHKNYLMNTAVMWCVAVGLPLFFKRMGGFFALPIGFAILSLNTPVCILLSCDKDLEQAVRFLPGQKKAFCIPYCLFIFLCNMAANVIFLLSWQVQNGNVTFLMVGTAVFFALQSAILSVLLEWFYPIRGWKIESDLWHHPRKYIVPVMMLLLAICWRCFE